ncbi:MAG: Cupredoxin-like protein [Acidimicrobiales bacterium]|nr:Cupredoxin-like protein [Acidimicrobiales bacterium]
MRGIRWALGATLLAGAWVLPVPVAEGTGTLVHLSGSAYSPATATVTVGESVTWVNDDPFDHTVTADGGAFDSSPSCPPSCMGPGASFTFTFATAGRFTYHCQIHGSAMSGTVIVQAAPSTTTPTSTGPPTTTINGGGVPAAPPPPSRPQALAPPATAPIAVAGRPAFTG